MSEFVAAAVPKELREQFPNAEWLSVKWAEQSCIAVTAIIDGKEREARVDFDWGDLINDTIISDLAQQLAQPA